ncbi:MAG: type II secretion system protein [Acidobacteria bacterium]|nr:type II secretion system protein [Acidobacteriota bacterium]
MASESATETKNIMDRENGFSLIELLIVVGIMLIVSAIAIPNFLRSRVSANEASAASSLKIISTTNVVYHALYNVGYAGSLAHLGPPSGGCATLSSICAGLLDPLLSGVSPATATPAKSGYRFTYYPAESSPTPVNPNTKWSAVAVPLNPGSSGHSTYCIDYTNTMWKDMSGGLTTATPPGCSATWPAGGSVVGPL